MQIQIVVADAGSAAPLADRLTDVFSASSMLSVCTAPECATVIFGRGTCVAHDPPRLHLADTLLDETVGRGRAPLATY
jgi:hypothetical protein